MNTLHQWRNAKENQILIEDKIMVKINNTRLVITGYHCCYFPCSSYKLFQF